MNINLDDNQKMKEAYDLVCNTNENVFITGKEQEKPRCFIIYKRIVTRISRW